MTVGICSKEIKEAAAIAGYKSPSTSVTPPAKPEYLKANGETVHDSQANAYIVLGNCPSNTPDIIKAVNSSTITLAAGIGTAIKNYQVPFNSKVTFSPYYYYDSAVISISEQTNVDSNFGYKFGSPKANNSSAIALKADELRMFARGSIKIVTGIDRMSGKEVLPGESNAKSHESRDYTGISLVANGTEVGLQPLVKGNNLAMFLNKALDEIVKLHQLINELFTYQYYVNQAVKSHTHMSDFTTEQFLRETDPALMAIGDLQNDILTKIDVNSRTVKIPNIENLRKNYLQGSGISYINSVYNKTN
jgi:hypothetical protein